MRAAALACAASLAAVTALAITACSRDGNMGYVEIKTVPSTVRAQNLYLDADKVDTSRGGTLVLRQPVGTAALQVDGDTGRVTLCRVVVRKNRITSLTISALDRPPRCQCGRSGPNDARTCIG